MPPLLIILLPLLRLNTVTAVGRTFDSGNDYQAPDPSYYNSDPQSDNGRDSYAYYDNPDYEKDNIKDAYPDEKLPANNKLSEDYDSANKIPAGNDYGGDYAYNNPAYYNNGPGKAQENYDYYEQNYENGKRAADYDAPQRARQQYRPLRNSRPDAKSGGYQMKPQKPQTKYVPVVVKKKKKKQKVISVSKGSFIPGGIQVFGKFKSLKGCMKACGATPNCFSGDYNPWTGKCYFHSNVTACDNMKSHAKITHFKKIPCTITDAPRGRILIGTQLFGAIEQKKIEDLPSCLKKCANLGPGISPSPTDLTGPLFGDHQLCFGINYDFSTHKCYFLINNHPRIEATDALAAFSLCPIEDDTAVRVPVDLQPNPTVITILLCPPIN